MKSLLRRAVDFAIPVLSVLALLLAWEIAVRLSGLNPVIFPPPSRILQTALRLFVPSGGRSILTIHILASLSRLVIALALAIPVGVVLGLAAGVNRYAYRTIYPLVNALNPVPPYAYIPLMLVWLGPGDLTIVLVTALSAALPLAYNTMAGVRGVHQPQVWVLQTFGAGRGAVVRHVILPAALTSILSGLRLSFGQAWRSLIGAEFLAARGAGLGFLIFNAQQFLSIDVMLAGVIALGILGFVLIHSVIAFVEDRTVVQWGVLARR